MSYWRDTAREVIQRVLADVPADASTQAKRDAISAAYPFGERRYWPYKVWLDEVRKALANKGTYRVHHPDLPGQGHLF